MTAVQTKSLQSLQYQRLCRCQLVRKEASITNPKIRIVSTVLTKATITTITTPPPAFSTTLQTTMIKHPSYPNYQIYPPHRRIIVASFTIHTSWHVTFSAIHPPRQHQIQQQLPPQQQMTQYNILSLLLLRLSPSLPWMAAL